MNGKAFKALKIVVPVVTVAATLASNFLGKKEQEETIAKKVAEALAKQNGEES